MAKKKKIRIETYGCAVNQADSEIMAGLLSGQGFESGDNSGIVIVNTCAVKTPTERKILKRLNELKNSKNKVIVTGCLPASQPNVVENFPDFSFIGTNVFDILNAVNSVFEGRRFVRIENELKHRVCTPRIRRNPFIGIIPIAQGCTGSCSYCIVRKARGTLRSYPSELIVKDVEKALSEGVKEIWITAQDTGAYGIDISEDLPGLLRRITEIKGNFRIRVGMMNPNHALRFLNELIEIYKNEKIYKFLHIPVQSGDDNVLRDMERRYSVNEFREIVSKFRRNIPEITISTDVIVGFPTEDDTAFQNSVNLLREIEPDILNISRFWARPGTKAERMKQLHGRITKSRSRRMSKLFEEIGLKRNRRWIGWKGKALVSEIGKSGSFCARNFAYKPIILKSGKNLLGRFVNVEIIDATSYDLRGRLI